MSREGRDREKRAQEAYMQTHQRVGRVTVSATQLQAAAEEQRVAQIPENERRLSAAVSAALASMDANGLPDGIIRTHRGRYGWLLYASTGGGVRYSEEDNYYFIADGTFERFYHHEEDSAHPIREVSDRMTTRQIAEMGQGFVNYTINKLQQLTGASPTPEPPVWPYDGD